MMFPKHNCLYNDLYCTFQGNKSNLDLTWLCGLLTLSNKPVLLVVLVSKFLHYSSEFKSLWPPDHKVTIIFYTTKCMMLYMMSQWCHHDVIIVGHMSFPSFAGMGHICPSSPVMLKSQQLDWNWPPTNIETLTFMLMVHPINVYLKSNMQNF